jgi:hypothetical protein
MTAFTSQNGLLSPVGRNQWTFNEDCLGNVKAHLADLKLTQVKLIHFKCHFFQKICEILGEGRVALKKV